MNLNNSPLEDKKSFCLQYYDNNILIINKYSIYCLLKLEYSGQTFSQQNLERDIINNKFEITKNGNLYQYVYYGEPFNEEEIKFIFYKILKCVKTLHNNSYCHLDLELGNIMFDANYNPVVFNFGTGLGVKGNENLKNFDGIITEYTPPELKGKEYNYNGYKVDIYNLGIMLNKFITIQKTANATSNNNIIPSEELKILINNMTTENPDNRYEIDDVLKSDWLKKMSDTFESKKEEFYIMEKNVKEKFERKKKDIIKSMKLNIIENIDTMNIPNVENAYSKNPVISEMSESEIYNYNIIMIPVQLNATSLSFIFINKIEKDNEHYRTRMAERKKYKIYFEFKKEFNNENYKGKRTLVLCQLYKINNKEKYFFRINIHGNNIYNLDEFYANIESIKKILNKIIEEEIQKNLEKK